MNYAIAYFSILCYYKHMSYLPPSAYVRLTHLSHRTPEVNSKRRMIRLSSVLVGIALMTAIDASDAQIDACAYEIDGREEVRNSLVIHPEKISELISGDCFPSIEIGQQD